MKQGKLSKLEKKILEEHDRRVRKTTLGFQLVEITPICYSKYQDGTSRPRTFFIHEIDTKDIYGIRRALEESNIPFKADVSVWRNNGYFYYQYGRRPVIIVKGKRFYTRRRFLDKRFKECSSLKRCQTQAQIVLTLLKRLGYARIKWLG